MTLSVGDHSNLTLTESFVRGGEHRGEQRGELLRRKKGSLNTTEGSVPFTSEESTSFYGNLVGIPSNIRLRTSSTGGKSSWASGTSGRGTLIERTGEESCVPSSSVPASNLPESNIGFQLLKKSGWTEGTGLGATEQGRLAPVETQVKQDRRGIGAEQKEKKQVVKAREERQDQQSKVDSDEEKDKGLSKKARKARAKAEREQEQALAQEFYREFWPENV